MIYSKKELEYINKLHKKGLQLVNSVDSITNNTMEQVLEFKENYLKGVHNDF